MSIKNYTIECPTCSGNGLVMDYPLGTTGMTRTCKACQGSGVVMVSEVSNG